MNLKIASGGSKISTKEGIEANMVEKKGAKARFIREMFLLRLRGFWGIRG